MVTAAPSNQLIWIPAEVINRWLRKNRFSFIAEVSTKSTDIAMGCSPHWLFQASFVREEPTQLTKKSGIPTVEQSAVFNSAAQALFLGHCV